jgi:glycosyltransferase involved in cell wall biosynthesis
VEFWTSTEYLAFMSGLMRELQRDGVDAVQLFHVSYSDYRIPRSSISRLWLRFRMYGIYPFVLAWHCLFLRRPTVLVVCTNTFYAPLVASLAAWGRNRKVIHLVYDLYPDVLIHAGSLKKDSLGSRILDRITRLTLRRCAANVFLGERLLTHARSRFGDIPKAAIIAVGADGEAFKNHPPVLRVPSEPVKILYCGNMGRMHDVQTLCRLLGDESWRPAGRLQIQFHANGAGFKTLQNLASSFIKRNEVELHFGAVLPDAEWVQKMLEADVALVTMIPGAGEVVMPSKTYSALVAGQAVLAVCSPDSDLASLIRNHNCGWIVTPGDDGGLKLALDEISQNRDLLLTRRQNAFRAGQQYYDVKAISQEWKRLLNVEKLKL